MTSLASGAIIPRQVDVIVLGGGIIGTAQALELQMRGRSVALIDRRAPGGETSFGNAGLIERGGVVPHPFPRDPLLLLQYALKLKSEANYHLADFFHITPFLWRYFRASGRAGQQRTIEANLPLFDVCLSEHQRLANAAGAEAMLRPGGWIKAYRSAHWQQDAAAAIAELAPYGVQAKMLDRAGVQALEPHISDAVAGGIHWQDPYFLNDPEALTLAYARHFEALGGLVLAGDARGLAQVAGGWSLASEGGIVKAADCVIALGPWSPDILAPLGYKIPMGVKRGYHVHVAPRGNAVLSRPVYDAEFGYVMAPMRAGIRLTSGAEFAHRDSPPTPVQIDQIEPKARELFPLDARVETTPWMGRRPCLPDLLPVMGRASRHKGLWLNFGHAHHGLTLAGSSARLLAEMITGEAPFTDPMPYALERFE